MHEVNLLFRSVSDQAEVGATLGHGIAGSVDLGTRHCMSRGMHGHQSGRAALLVTAPQFPLKLSCNYFCAVLDCRAGLLYTLQSYMVTWHVSTYLYIGMNTMTYQVAE